MDVFVTMGLGFVCPARNSRVLFLLLLLLACNVSLPARTYTGDPQKMTTVIVLEDLAGAEAVLEVQNFICDYPGHSCTAINASLIEQGKAILVDIIAPHELPVGIDLGAVTLHDENGSRTWRLQSDGWTIMVVIDDF